MKLEQYTGYRSHNQIKDNYERQRNKQAFVYTFGGVCLLYAIAFSLSYFKQDVKPHDMRDLSFTNRLERIIK